MSILMKRRRSLLRRVILLTTLALTVAGWLPFTQPQAQQIDTQQAQRPRRVNGSEQNPETKKPDTPSAGDEVDEGDVVRVDTQLVSLPAVVTDAAGRPVSGLRAE